MSLAAISFSISVFETLCVVNLSLIVFSLVSQKPFIFNCFASLSPSFISSFDFPALTFSSVAEINPCFISLRILTRASFSSLLASSPLIICIISFSVRFCSLTFFLISFSDISEAPPKSNFLDNLSPASLSSSDAFLAIFSASRSSLLPINNDNSSVIQSIKLLNGAVTRSTNPFPIFFIPSPKLSIILPKASLKSISPLNHAFKALNGAVITSIIPPNISPTALIIPVKTSITIV